MNPARRQLGGFYLLKDHCFALHRFAMLCLALLCSGLLGIALLCIALGMPGDAWGCLGMPESLGTPPRILRVGGGAERWRTLIFLFLLVLSISIVPRASIEENCGSDWSRKIRAAGFHFGVKQ